MSSISSPAIGASPSPPMRPRRPLTAAVASASLQILNHLSASDRSLKLVVIAVALLRQRSLTILDRRLPLLLCASFIILGTRLSKRLQLAAMLVGSWTGLIANVGRLTTWWPDAYTRYLNKHSLPFAAVVPSTPCRQRSGTCWRRQPSIAEEENEACDD